MPDNEFVKGVRLETKQGQYGEYIKGSINVEDIFCNPLNNNKWLNFMMFKSKAGNWYIVNAKPKNQPQENIVKFEQEELPF